MNNQEKKTRNPYAFPNTDGMTLKDYFAAKALQGICVNVGRNGFYFANPEIIAKQCYELADAMLIERSKRK
jgi:hypothetical protein